MRNFLASKMVRKLLLCSEIEYFRIDNVSTQTSNKSINKIFQPVIKHSIACINLKKFIINENINYIDWSNYINDFEKKFQFAINMYENEMSTQSKQFNKNKKVQSESINNYVIYNNIECKILYQKKKFGNTRY
jgi:hypothetical protein